MGAVGQHRLAQCGAQLCVGRAHIGAACQQVGGLPAPVVSGTAGRATPEVVWGASRACQVLSASAVAGARPASTARAARVPCSAAWVWAMVAWGLFALGLGGQVFASVG